jgi:hypothetical protein
MSQAGDHAFDRLADELERILRGYGEPYQRGAGDYLVVQDDYGIQELAVILCRALPLTTAIPEVQRCIQEAAPGWKVRIGANAGVEWNDDKDLVIDAVTSWSEARPAS